MKVSTKMVSDQGPLARRYLYQSAKEYMDMKSNVENIQYQLTQGFEAIAIKNIAHSSVFVSAPKGKEINASKIISLLIGIEVKLDGGIDCDSFSVATPDLEDFISQLTEVIELGEWR